MTSYFPWKMTGLGSILLSLLLSSLSLEFPTAFAAAEVVEIGADGSTKTATKPLQQQLIVGQLRPVDLAPPQIYSDYAHNTTFELPNGKNIPIAPGSVRQVNKHIQTTAGATEFTILPGVMVDEEKEEEEEELPPFPTKSIYYKNKNSHYNNNKNISKVLDLLRSFDGDYDKDPDTVDGMPTYEIFVDHPNLHDMDRPSYKVLDRDPQALPERRKLRDKLQTYLRPVLEETLTPYIRKNYADVCQQRRTKKNKDESTSDDDDNDDDIDIDCYPCYSLIRRYRHGERQSHATHHDVHALVTAVVSLSSHGIDYEGGLYVASAHGPRQFLALQAGDAVVHRSMLLHGVQVSDIQHDDAEKTERWSWIIWYSDSKDCLADHSYEWFAECSDAGHPTCQQLHSTHISADPVYQNDKDALVARIVELSEKAALGGDGTAAVKMARAYLKLLPSNVSRDVAKAKEFYEMAIDSGSVEGHYGLADMYIRQANSLQKRSMERQDGGDGSANVLSKRVDSALKKAVWHLEQGAMLGHPFSMFNLGIAHVFGYGMEHKGDVGAAIEWFIESGLPEGYHAASISIKEPALKQTYDDLARTLGHYEEWRKEFRERGGSGGAGGVDLNMKWPLSEDGRSPPQF